MSTTIKDDIRDSINSIKLLLDRELVTRYRPNIDAFNFYQDNDKVIIELNTNPYNYRFEKYSFAEYFYESIRRLHLYIKSRPNISKFILDISLPNLTHEIDFLNMIELVRYIIDLIPYNEIRIRLNDMNDYTSKFMNTILNILSQLDYKLTLLHVFITGKYYNTIPFMFDLQKPISVDTLQLSTNGSDLSETTADWLSENIDFENLIDDERRKYYG